MAKKSVLEVKTELKRLYGEWFAAIPRHDEAFFEALLADDWVYTNHYGEVRGKRDYLEYLKHAVPGDAAPNTLTEFAARVFGGMVIVHGRYLVKHPAGAHEDLRFTAVWIEHKAGWQALAHHSTTVTERR